LPRNKFKSLLSNVSTGRRLRNGLKTSFMAAKIFQYKCSKAHLLPDQLPPMPKIYIVSSRKCKRSNRCSMSLGSVTS